MGSGAPARPKKGSPEELELAIALRASGMSYREIGRRLRRCGKWVARKLPSDPLGYAARFRKWTPGEIQQAAELYTAGLTYRAIGAQLGRPRHSVEHVLRRTGRMKTKACDGVWTEEQLDVLSDMLRAGATYGEIGTRLGRSESSVGRRVAKMRREVARDAPEIAKGMYRVRRWTEAEKDLLVQMHCRGWSLQRMAKRLDRTPNAVKVALCRHRKLANSDPKFRVAMTVLEFCLDPARVLRAVRDSGIVPELTESDSDEDLARLLFQVRKGWG